MSTPATLDIPEGRWTAANLLATRLLPFIPPLALLAAIYRFAVNVPYGNEWDLTLFVERLLDGTLGRAFLLIADIPVVVKLVLAPLALATDFDVTAQMYAGFGFQLLAFIFLWSVLELTLRACYRRLIAPVSIAIALLMFSLAYDQTWLSGLASLQSSMSSLTAAATVWLLARWPTKAGALGISLLLSWIAMGLPSGAVLWGIILTAVAMRHLTPGRIQWQRLASFLIGMLLLATAYFSGFATLGEQPHVSYLSLHPLRSCAFVLVYLGFPLTHAANLWIAGGAGAAGLVLLIVAVAMAWHDALKVRSVQPWLWLSIYAVLAAVLAASSRLEHGVESAVTQEYNAGSLFWVAFVVIAAVALEKRYSEEASQPHWIGTVVAIAVIGCAINYGRIYCDGYLAFAHDHSERIAGLIELYEDEQNNAQSSLYGDTDRLWEYVEVMKKRRLGPFSPHMLESQRDLQNAITFASKVGSGQGYLDVADCTVIAGWAWDSQQPDIPVKVDIYDDETFSHTARSSRFRPDLLKAHIGNGRHAFVFTLPQRLKDDRSHTIRAKISGTNIELYGSPKQLACR